MFLRPKSPRASRSCSANFWFPIRLASEKLTYLPPSAAMVSISLRTCGIDFSRGMRPSVMMMSQNSHANGQPRVVWTK